MIYVLNESGYSNDTYSYSLQYSSLLREVEERTFLPHIHITLMVVINDIFLRDKTLPINLQLHVGALAPEYNIREAQW